MNNRSSKFVSVPETQFYHELLEYIQKVDDYLKKMICTFHNIIKNSLL